MTKLSSVYLLIATCSAWGVFTSYWTTTRNISSVWIDTNAPTIPKDGSNRSNVAIHRIDTVSKNNTLSSLQENSNEIADTTKLPHKRELFRNCTSPEASIPWPFYNDRQHGTPPPTVATNAAHSLLNPHLKCGLGLGRNDRGESSDSNNTGSNEDNGKSVRFMEYFEQTVKKKIIQPILDKEGCNDMVVYGTAFGSQYVEYMEKQLESEDESEDRVYNYADDDWIVNADELVEKHGRCFFMFVYPNKEDDRTEEEEKPIQLGHYWMIPLRPEALPYKNARRNTKLFKFMGQYAFLNHYGNDSGNGAVSPDVIVWQDAKFFNEYSGFTNSIPRDYSTVLRSNDPESPYGDPEGDSTSSTKESLPCLVAVGLPPHKASYGNLARETSMGLTVSSYNRPQFNDHCQTIVDALKKREVTDSRESVIHQCRAYTEFVSNQKHSGANQGKGERDSLTFGMTDNAFAIWNESTKQCRDFNANFRCTMLDQLQCHSDRDQLSFPLVVHQLLAPSRAASDSSDTDIQALKAVYYNSWTESMTEVDKDWKPHAHNLDLVDLDATLSTDYKHTQVYVRRLRSACHHYYFKGLNEPYGERSCGHKVWLGKHHDAKNPSLDQEKALLLLAGTLRDNQTIREKNATLVAMARARGNHDRIEAPFKADFHKCTSPEFAKVPYAFMEENEDKKKSSQLSCGTGSENLSSFHLEIRKNVVIPKVQQLVKENKCTDLVVFGTAFGNDLLTLSPNFDNQSSTKETENDSNNDGRKHSKYEDCVFLFVDDQDLQRWKVKKMYSNNTQALRGSLESTTPSVISASGVKHWLIPVEKSILPYESMDRNSMFFRYSGQFFFPDAKNIVYQDTSLFDPPFRSLKPFDYDSLYSTEGDHSVSGPCLTARSPQSERVSVKSSTLYQDYCNLMIRFMKKQLHISVESITQQCDAYIQFVYKRELDLSFLNQGMIDTGFMSWNESTEYCRDFNAKLRCIILDQLHCHTDRDSMLFPFALYVHQMGLGYSTTEYKSPEKESRKLVDDHFKKTKMDLHMFRQVTEKAADTNSVGSKREVVRIIAS